MHHNSIRSTWTINIYLIILFCNTKSSSVTLDNLKLVCMHDFPFDYKFDHEPPDELCTAKGTFNQHPIPEDVDINALRGKKPYVFYFQTQIFSDFFEEQVIQKNVSIFYDEIIDLLKDKNVDVLVLDFTLKAPFVIEKPIREINDHIVDLIDEIKFTYPKMLYGLQLFNNAHDYDDNKVFMLDILDASFDLYVVSSYNYNRCKYEKKQAKMAKPPSAQDLVKIFESILYHQNIV